MKIFTYPKIGIEQEYRNGIDNSENVLISILSSVDTPLSNEVKSSYKHVLELRFDDLPFNISFKEENDSESEFYQMISFAFYHYARVYKFIKYNLKNFDGNIKVHCTAGISRSGAVAIGISLIKKDFALYRQIMQDNEIIPNQLVLSYFIQNLVGSDNYWFNLIDVYKTILRRK